MTDLRIDPNEPDPLIPACAGRQVGRLGVQMPSGRYRCLTIDPDTRALIDCETCDSGRRWCSHTVWTFPASSTPANPTPADS